MFGGTFLCGLCSLGMMSKKAKHESLWLAFAGAISACVTDCSTYSLDTINSRSKVLGEKMVKSKAEMVKACRSLNRGISASFYGSLFYGYVYFYLYNNFKKILRPFYNGKPTPSMYMGAAAMTEMMALSVYFPFELIKIRMQTCHERYNYKSVWDAFRQIK